MISLARGFRHQIAVAAGLDAAVDSAAVVPGCAFITVGMFLFGGIQLLMMGVIGSCLGRVYVETQDRPLSSLGLTARGPGSRPRQETGT